MKKCVLKVKSVLVNTVFDFKTIRAAIEEHKCSTIKINKYNIFFNNEPFFNYYLSVF
jgi:hypothetical protein